MQINREIIAIELDKLIDTIFQLPEVAAVKVRDVVMEKGEDRSEKLQEAMEKSYHDCCSDVDLAVLVMRSPKDTVTESEYMRRIDRIGNRKNDKRAGDKYGSYKKTIGRNRKRKGIATLSRIYRRQRIQYRTDCKAFPEVEP